MIICVRMCVCFRYMMVCSCSLSRSPAIDSVYAFVRAFVSVRVRVWVCMGTFSIRWIKKISDCYFLPHSAIYLNCYSLLSRLRGSGSFAIHMYFGPICQGELSKMEFPSFRLCRWRYIIEIVILCNLCDTVVLCTHHLLHQVCVMIKPFYYKFVFRTAVWILDLKHLCVSPFIVI